MPDSDVMPIGEDGYFHKVVEVLWIEDDDRRRVFTKDGRLLFDSHDLMPSVAIPGPIRPPITVGRVLEFDINRFGHLHSDAELQGIRAAVCELTDSLKRPLRIIDTFGWSGEVALALCRVDSSDIVTIVDDLSGVDRFTEPWSDSSEHFEVLSKNLGPLLESRIQHSPNDAALLPAHIIDEFDLVFIDTASNDSRQEDLVDAWLPLLCSDGVFVGTSIYFKAIAGGIARKIGERLPFGPVCILPKRMIEAWHALEETEVA